MAFSYIIFHDSDCLPWYFYGSGAGCLDQHFELLCRHTGVKRSHNFTGHPKDGEKDLIRSVCPSSNHVCTCIEWERDMGRNRPRLPFTYILPCFLIWNIFYIGQGGFGDSAVMEPPRGRGVQFPFAVMDRVIIKVVCKQAWVYL